MKTRQERKFCVACQKVRPHCSVTEYDFRLHKRIADWLLCNFCNNGTEA